MGFAGWMFVEVIRNKTLTMFPKVMWTIGLLVLGPLIAIAYAFLQSHKRAHQVGAVLTFICLVILLGFPQLFMSGAQ